MKIFLKILSAIALLVWATCFALGFNYQQGGALVISITLAVLLLIFMGIFLFLMSRWSNPNKLDNKGNAQRKEIICVSLYVIVVLLSVSSVAHFITVQSSVKNDVKPMAQQRIAELERVFGDETTSESYLNHIETKVIPVYRTYLESKYNDSESVTVALARLKEDLTQNGQFEALQDEVNEFLGYCRYSVENWVPWTIPSYLFQLDYKLKSWESQVKTMSINSQWTANEPYEVKSIATEKLINRIMSPSSTFSGLAILLIVVLQFAIVLFYLAGRDWNRHGPTKFKGEYAVWDSNDVKDNKNIKQNQKIF